MRHYLLFIFLFSFFAVNNLQAQLNFYDNDYSENIAVFQAGISLGAMNAFTDLGGTKGKGGHDIQDFNLKNTQACGSVYLAAVYKNFVVIRLEGTFGRVKAYDSILNKVASTTTGRLKEI